MALFFITHLLFQGYGFKEQCDAMATACFGARNERIKTDQRKQCQEKVFICGLYFPHMD
jgi:hypothetical protein